MVKSHWKGSIIMSYEFMDMINDHVETRLQDEQERLVKQERAKELRTHQIVFAICSSVFFLLTFLLETPH